MGIMGFLMGSKHSFQIIRSRERRGDVKKNYGSRSAYRRAKKRSPFLMRVAGRAATGKPTEKWYK